MIEKINTPLAIIIGSIVLGMSFYYVQIDKRESIEKQQVLENERLQTEKQQAAETAELKAKQDECESLAVGVRKKWNNVMGVAYDSKLWKQCVVTYTDTKTGEVTTSPLSSMKDTSY
jgi:hypothetical protein